VTQNEAEVVRTQYHYLHGSFKVLDDSKRNDDLISLGRRLERHLRRSIKLDLAPSPRKSTHNVS
jgi:hypothetical protein